MTEILATVKPGESASHDLVKVSALIRLGVSAVRVNLGRRSLADNLRLLASASAVRPGPPLLFADLPGVKGRLGEIVPSPMRVSAGDTIVLDTSPTLVGTTGRLPYRVPPGEPLPGPGGVLALDDGRVRLRVADAANGIRCVVEVGEAIPRFTGVLDISHGGPYGRLTTADRELARAVSGHVDFLCPSFADSAAMVDELEQGPTRPRRGVIAKIEAPRGVDALPELVDAGAGVMLARGDLSVFYDSARMREIATRMTSEARARDKIVVFASNFFRGLAAPPYRLTGDERRTLDWVAGQAPDFLLLNETAYSPAWEEVAAVAVARVREWAV